VINRILQAFPADLGPIFVLQIPLGSDFVRVDDVEKLGSVAAASGVFQQQRIVKVGLGVEGQANLARQPHADHAALHGMPERLTLGQIERIGERGDDVGGRH
jgi:hypothetical protein